MTFPFTEKQPHFVMLTLEADTTENLKRKLLNISGLQILLSIKSAGY